MLAGAGVRPFVESLADSSNSTPADRKDIAYSSLGSAAAVLVAELREHMTKISASNARAARIVARATSDRARQLRRLRRVELETRALFDCDPEKIGRRAARADVVRDVRGGARRREEKLDVVVIAVPARPRSAS